MVSVCEETISIGGRTLIEDLSLSIDVGDRVAILGKNGAGKSVLAKLLGDRVPSGGFSEDLAPGVAQRQALGRGVLGLGLDELRALDDEARSSVASPFASVTGSPTHCRFPEAPRGAHYVSFESHRKLLRDERAEFAESRFTSVRDRGRTFRVSHLSSSSLFVSDGVEEVSKLREVPLERFSRALGQESSRSCSSRRVLEEGWRPTVFLVTEFEIARNTLETHLLKRE